MSRAVDKPCPPPSVAPSLPKIYLQVKSLLKQKHLIPLRGPPTSLLVSQPLLEPERILVTPSLRLSRKLSSLLNHLHSFRRPSLHFTSLHLSHVHFHYLEISKGLHSIESGAWALHLFFSSVTQSCPTLCDSMDTPGFPVHHQLLELAQTHVHRVGDAIQPSQSLSSPSPPTFNLPQHQGFC